MSGQDHPSSKHQPTRTPSFPSTFFDWKKKSLRLTLASELLPLWKAALVEEHLVTPKKCSSAIMSEGQPVFLTLEGDGEQEC